MIKKYSLTSINGLEGSLLRKDFESFNEKIAMRKINLNKVTDDIVDLEERPEYNPNIRIFQLRKINHDLFYVFNETIYTSNEFLNEFEMFLRTNEVPVDADNFEDVPKEYKHFFETPYTRVPVDMLRRETVVSYPNGNKETIARYDQFKGVDFNSSCTLKMLEPEKLYNKLEQIEKSGNFSVVIKKDFVKGDSETIAFEYRRGNEHMTVDHLVFRN